MPLRRLSLLLLVLVPVFARGAAPGVYAITGGRVHRVSQPPLDNATVVIRDGLIQQVGTNVTPPPDAFLIDARGQHVYPAFIDAFTNVGLPAAPRRATGGSQAASPQDAAAEISAAAVAARTLKLNEEAVDLRRAVGVATVLAAPSTAIFNGQAALVNLLPDGDQSRIIKSPAASVVAFNPRSRAFPDSLMGVVAFMRQNFLDAQRYAAASEIYRKDPAGKRRIEQSPDLEALGVALTREIPVVFVADSELLMTRSLGIAREFNLRPVIAGARESFDHAEMLRSAAAPILVSVSFPKPSGDASADAALPMRLLRERVLAPTAPAVLDQKGVRFALVSNGAGADDFIDGVRLAIRAGLSAESALRALTLAPAEIFGVGRQLGSLDAGKIANVIISEKPIFDEGVKPRMMFIDGTPVRLPKPGAARNAGSQTAADQTWNVVVQTADGAMNLRITLRSEGTTLAGNYTSDRGSGDIRNGTREGDRVRFTLVMQTSPDSETSDWNFDGTVSGNSINGTVTTTLGQYTFSGSAPQ